MRSYLYMSAVAAFFVQMLAKISFLQQLTLMGATNGIVKGLKIFSSESVLQIWPLPITDRMSSPDKVQNKIPSGMPSWALSPQPPKVGNIYFNGSTNPYLGQSRSRALRKLRDWGACINIVKGELWRFCTIRW